MKQSEFIASRSTRWLKWDKCYKQVKGKEYSTIPELPRLYREICYDYMLAKSRNYSLHLQQELQIKINQGHQLLYREKSDGFNAFMKLMVLEFPATLRHFKRTTLLCFVFFFGAMALFAGITYFDDAFIYYFVAPGQVASMEMMYDPSGPVQSMERHSDDDFRMFGVYVLNNISIAFRTFIYGLLLGLGSLYFLSFNAAVLGCVTGYLVQIGFSETFFPFVVTHGAFELTAIVIAGIAGLNLGFSVVAPGPYERIDALKFTANKCLVLMYGTTVFLLIGSFIEAFWSSADYIGDTVKYTVGGICWLLVLLYLFFAGHYDES